MKNKYIPEIIISLILITLLLICLNPFNLLMPSPMIKMLVVLIILVFGIFTTVIWKEKPTDERENLHKGLAGHFAFLVGTFILIIGIAIQELNHNLDPWLIYALIGMVLGKIIYRAYLENKK